MLIETNKKKEWKKDPSDKNMDLLFRFKKKNSHNLRTITLHEVEFLM
jgi:hypothetical protein